MSGRYLRRYTNLPSLIYLLSKRKVTLLDPRSWDDTNDAYLMSVYKEKKQLRSLLALCFSEVPEAYHHWRVFGSGSSGVCVRFSRQELLRAIKNRPNIRVGAVSYLRLTDLGNDKPKLDDLPFVKRVAFQDEGEFRVIYESSTKRLQKLDIPIPLSCIDKVTLSPWLHVDLVEPLSRVLKSIERFQAVQVVRSRLLNNERWRKAARSASE